MRTIHPDEYTAEQAMQEEQAEDRKRVIREAMTIKSWDDMQERLISEEAFHQAEYDLAIQAAMGEMGTGYQSMTDAVCQSIELGIRPSAYFCR